MDDFQVKVHSPDRGVWNMHASLLVDAATKHMVMIEIPTSSTKCCVDTTEDNWFHVFEKPRTWKFDEMTGFHQR